MSRINRIYYPHKLELGLRFSVSDDTHHYINRVLRISKGDTIRFFNDTGQEFECVLLSIERKSSTYRCEQEVSPIAEPTIAVQLDIAVCKAGRMDIAFQKATELGVTSFQPLYCAHNQQHHFRAKHLRAVVRSAAEQCGRARIPEIAAPISATDIPPIAQDEMGVLLDPTAVGQSLVLTYTEELSKVRIAVGPEGGWQDQELSHFKEQGFVASYLGERVLRNETAVLAALALVQSQIGQLG